MRSFVVLSGGGENPQIVNNLAEKDFMVDLGAGNWSLIMMAGPTLNCLRAFS